MDPARADPWTFGGGECLLWLGVCPPLQPELIDGPAGTTASNDGAANQDLESVEDPVWWTKVRCRDRGPCCVARSFDSLTERIGSDVDQADCIFCQERREAVYAAASLGIGECPGWLIVAIEQGPPGRGEQES
jgi:hypothetical protein